MQNRQEYHDWQWPGRSQFASLDSESGDSWSSSRVFANGESTARGFIKSHRGTSIRHEVKSKSSRGAKRVVTRCLGTVGFSRQLTCYLFKNAQCRIAARLTENDGVTAMQTIQRKRLMHNRMTLIKCDRALRLLTIM